VVVGVTDKDVVTRSFRQQFSKRVANLEWYADGEVVAVEDVTNPTTPEVALYWQLAMQTKQLTTVNFSKHKFLKMCFGSATDLYTPSETGTTAANVCLKQPIKSQTTYSW